MSSLSDGGFTIYTTIFPCHSCIKNLLAYNVQRIVFKEKYSEKEFEKSIDLLKETKAKVEKMKIIRKRVIDILLNQKKRYFNTFPQDN